MGGLITARIVGTIPTVVAVNLNKAIVPDSMRQGYMRSGPHGSRTESRSFGKPYPSIATELGKQGNWTEAKRGTLIEITGVINHPGAAIQNRGGVIQARKARGRFIYWGNLVYTKKLLRPSVIRAKNYVAHGFDVIRDRMDKFVQVVFQYTKVGG